MKIEDDLLSINPFSRPGQKRPLTMAVALHWVGNPGTSPKQNRDYWESLKSQNPADPAAHYASAHYIVGIDGSILRTVPEDEKAYAVAVENTATPYAPWARAHLGKWAADPAATSPNWVVISIEMCHLDWDGHFSDATLGAVLDLCVDVFTRNRLGSEWLTTHNLITRKDCPRLWTLHPELFEAFRAQLAARLAA